VVPRARAASRRLLDPQAAIAILIPARGSDEGSPALTAEDGLRRDPRALRRLQWRVACLTWLSYASYYLTRKHFSVVKSRLQTDLGISTTGLGLIDTAYLAAYAIGQFINGALGDRVGARRMLAIGMIASAAISLALGASSVFAAFLILFGVNGLFQSTGWPNNVKAMAPWFGRRERGRVMGIWCTNYQVGGIASTALATYLLVHYGWRWSFRIPGVWVAALGVVILLALIESPAERGLRGPDSGVDGRSAAVPATAASTGSAPPQAGGLVAGHGLLRTQAHSVQPAVLAALLPADARL
jgi:sugar phosphate permease